MAVVLALLQYDALAVTWLHVRSDFAGEGETREKRREERVRRVSFCKFGRQPDQPTGAVKILQPGWIDKWNRQPVGRGNLVLEEAQCNVGVDRGFTCTKEEGREASFLGFLRGYLRTLLAARQNPIGNCKISFSFRLAMIKTTVSGPTD